MASLLGSQPKVIPEFTGLQVNTAVQVLPIPIIYGCPRVSVNVIYYNGFASKLVSASSGKGPGGGKGGKSVQYFATFIAAIGEGPIIEIFVIYQDAQVWTPANFPTNGAFLFMGTPTQTPWSYVTTRWPQDSRSYKDTAYYAFSNAQIDAGATIPQLNLVPSGIFKGSSPLNNSTITISTGQYDQNGNPISFIGNIVLNTADADPAAVIFDFLTNVTYGATFPIGWIDTAALFTSPAGFDPTKGDAALATYCQAVGLAWSVAINNVESANSILDRWCKNLNVAPVWNGATLRFIPYWDRFNGSNPGWDPTNGIAKKYFLPNTTAIVNITMDFVLESTDKSEDPISFTRKDPLEVYNTIRIAFKDRTNFFNDNPMEAKDEVHAELYGPRVDNIGTASEFSLATYANVSATLQLRRNIAIMRTFTWKMGPLWGWLDPMNIVSIPDPTNVANEITVRIISIEDDEDENVTIVAEEFPLGSQAPTTVPTSPSTPPNQGPTNIPPSPIYTPVIFAPTLDMLTATGFATPQVIFGASGGNTPVFNGVLDPNWGGCNIWVSVDDISYTLLGQLSGPSVVGVVSMPLPAFGGANPDNVDVLQVNLNESDGTLASVPPASAAAGHSICVLQDVSGFEIIAFTNAVLASSFTYNLTGLYRGLYGTTSRNWGVGSRFLYVGTSANIFETSLPAAYVGKTLWIKAPSFNVLNNATEDLSAVPAYQYVPTGTTPMPPTAPPMRRMTDGRPRRKVSTATKAVRRRPTT